MTHAAPRQALAALDGDNACCTTTWAGPLWSGN
jgi:hypothetical protein